MHILSLCGNRSKSLNENTKAIAELVQRHSADINIQDANRLTPLQRLISGPFEIENAMNLIHLGAKFELDKVHAGTSQSSSAVSTAGNHQKGKISDEEMIKILNDLLFQQELNQFNVVEPLDDNHVPHKISDNLFEYDPGNGGNPKKSNILLDILNACPVQQGDDALYQQKELAKYYVGHQGQFLSEKLKDYKLTADELLEALNDLKQRAGDSSVEQNEKSKKDLQFLRAMFDKKGKFKNKYSSDSQTYLLILQVFESVIMELDPTKEFEFKKQQTQRTAKAVGNSFLSIFSGINATKDSSSSSEKKANETEKTKNQDDTREKQKNNLKSEYTVSKLSILNQDSDSDDECIDENDKINKTKKSSEKQGGMDSVYNSL